MVFRSSDAESSILSDEATSKKPSAVPAVEQPSASGDQATSEAPKAARKTLRPLPAKQLSADGTSTKRLSSELAAPPARDQNDKENAGNAAPVP